MTKLPPNVINKCRTDICYFIEKIVNLTEPKINLLPYHKEWFELVKKHKRLSLMAFRSSGKSELFFVLYPIWRAFTQPNFQGILVSNSEKQAIRLLRRIKQRIESNPVLSTSIPSSRSDSWSKTELTLSNGSWIGSKPYNENLRGEHVDFIGADELGEYKDYEILKKVCLPMLRAKGGNFVGVGTPTSELDLLHTIEKEDFFRSFKTARYPAITPTKNYFEQRYPNTKIVDQGNIIELHDDGVLVDTFSQLDWSQEFLLKPLGDSDQLFPWQLIQYSFDNTQAFHYQPKNTCRYYFGVDFAISAQAAADYTVITVMEREHDSDEIRVVNIDRSKGLSYEMQKRKIQTLAQVYKPVKLLCDDGNVGKIFLQELKREGLPVEGYHFGGAGNIMSQNKRELFMKLREQFERQKIVINSAQNDLRTRQTVNYLMNEMSKFGIKVDKVTKSTKFEGIGKHDDMVDSLALAVWASAGKSSGSFAVARGGGVMSRGILVRTR